MDLSGQTDVEEVEHLMRNHASVKDAAAVIIQDDPDVEVIGFITLHDLAIAAQNDSLGQSGGEYETEQVQLWETVFDGAVYPVIDAQQPEAVGRDFTGWISAYDGSPLDKAEMDEWLEDAIEMIVTSSGGGHSLDVLELGTGSGMILFNLAPRLHSYHGIELSRAAVDFVTARAESIPDLAGKMNVYQGTATSLHLLESASPSIAIINSVAQYFPSHDYLSNVVEGILLLGSIRTIIFGDIRSHALRDEFLVSKALHTDGTHPSKDAMRQKLASLTQAELELLIDPAFFTRLQDQFPDLIGHVEILPKKMKATNELSCYRYAAVIHVKSRDRVGRMQHQEIRDVGTGEWVDFMAHELDGESLLHRLGKDAPDVLAVSNIPYSKTILERHVIDALNGETEGEDVQSPADWLSSVRERSQRCPSLSPLDLKALALQAGYQVEISCARQHSQRGGLDAIFHHYQPSSGGRVLFRFPTDHQGRAVDTLSTRPLQEQAKQTIQQEVYEEIQAQLPGHIILDDIVILDKLPTSSGGEVDREALAKLV